MEIEYTGRQTTITRKLKTQAEAGLARIAKLVGRTASAHVFLTTEKYRRIAEITLKKRGKSLVGTGEGTEMASVLHDALDRLEQQAVRHKEKRATGKRHPKAGQPSIKIASLQIEVETASMDGAGIPIVRKRTNGVAAGNGRNGHARRAAPMVVHSF